MSYHHSIAHLLCVESGELLYHSIAHLLCVESGELLYHSEEEHLQLPPFPLP
jgi:hypothetical protein